MPVSSGGTGMQIVAPACSPRQAMALIEAGADELYCGVLPDAWIREYGDGDLLTRRQGRPAHLRDMAELAEVARMAQGAACPVALTLNARYSAGQMPRVVDLARRWEDLGGAAVMTGDLGLLLELHGRSSLDLHLSLLAGVTNRHAAGFFAGLGVSRIVLPRDLTVAELGSVARGGEVEYEVLALHQRCPFVDGLCGFSHGVRIPEDTPAVFDYEGGGPGRPAVTWTSDPEYEGHGCQLPWSTGHGPVRGLGIDDGGAPHCGACQLAPLAGAGIGFVKIAGRGYPTATLVRGVEFLRGALRIGNDPGADASPGAAIEALYVRTFGRPCDHRCYFDGGSPG